MLRFRPIYDQKRPDAERMSLARQLFELIDERKAAGVRAQDIKRFDSIRFSSYSSEQITKFATSSDDPPEPSPARFVALALLPSPLLNEFKRRVRSASTDEQRHAVIDEFRQIAEISS
jgi:hypothetical protein